MKKVAVLLAIATLSFTACHYGKTEAHETVERNKKYKEGKETGPEISEDYIKGGAKAKDTAATATDTAAAPATQAMPAQN